MNISLIFLIASFVTSLGLGLQSKAFVLIAVSEDKQQELEQINKEIEQLKDLQNRYKAAEARHENDGNRWQFQQNMKQEARRAYQQAEFDREMQQQIQVRIDYLEKQRTEILNSH